PEDVSMKAFGQADCYPVLRALWDRYNCESPGTPHPGEISDAVLASQTHRQLLFLKKYGRLPSQMVSVSAENIRTCKNCKIAGRVNRRAEYGCGCGDILQSALQLQEQTR